MSDPKLEFRISNFEFRISNFEIVWGGMPLLLVRCSRLLLMRYYSLEEELWPISVPYFFPRSHRKFMPAPNLRPIHRAALLASATASGPSISSYIVFRNLEREGDSRDSP